MVAKGQLATWRGPRVRCTTSSRASRCGIRATITASGSVAAMGFGEARVVVGRGSLGDPSDAHMRRCQGHPRPSRGGRIRRPEHLRSELNPGRRCSPRWDTMASSEEVRGGRRSGSPARLHRGREPPTPNVAQRPAGGRRSTLLAISKGASCLYVSRYALSRAVATLRRSRGLRPPRPPSGSYSRVDASTPGRYSAVTEPLDLGMRDPAVETTGPHPLAGVTTIYNRAGRRSGLQSSVPR